MNKLKLLLGNINLLNIIMIAFVVLVAGYVVLPILNIKVKFTPSIPKKISTTKEEIPPEGQTQSPSDYLIIAEQNLFHPQRIIPPEKQAEQPLQKPDFVLAMIEFRDGPLARLTVNYYADWWKKEGELVEFHGDDGSLCLSHVSVFSAGVEYADYGKRYEPVAPVREPFQGIEWGRGVVDMAEALREGRPHRASGEQAAHIIEIMCAIDESAASNQPV